MNSSDPRLPIGRHPLAGGGISLPFITSLFCIINRPLREYLLLHFAEEALDSILHQAADGHRTHSTWDWSYH